MYHAAGGFAEVSHPTARRGRWGYYALPILRDDRLVGKVDAAVDRKASVLRVNAIHQDVPFRPTMMKAVQAELDDLASWLGVEGTPGGTLTSGTATVDRPSPPPTTADEDRHG